jgi:hypothetical protein
VNGTRENARRLLAAGEAVLVFPGGGREVARHGGDHYPLVWRERIGFARLAIEYSYAVVPFSMVGVDDMWDVVDSDSALCAPARALVMRLDVDPDMRWPLVGGLGPTPLPRPQRMNGRVSASIDASTFGSSWEDTDGARALRDAVRAAVARGIADLQAERELDPARRLALRLFGDARRLTRAQATELRRICTCTEARPGRVSPAARGARRVDHRNI